MSIENFGQKKLVYLMMSGGVDSSVAAYILSKNPLYEVRGVFMKCWSKETLLEQGYTEQIYACTWEDDLIDAKMVAKKLNMPFEVWDFQQEYKNYVVGYMISEYAKGVTPNPDVMCNSVVKFGAFYDRAILEGADYVATGHYAKMGVNKEGKPIIKQAKDSFKDQSYFLWKIKSERLVHTLFPIGEIENKAEVRKIALENGLLTADKKDSQGLCFVGKTSLREMLLQKIGKKEGKIVTDSMKYVDHCIKVSNKTKKEFEKNAYVILGEHKNACLFTIGQRDGLGLGGGPWLVSRIDISNNLVYVKHHLEANSLDSNSCTIGALNFFEPLEYGLKSRLKYYGQIRYNQEPVECSITNLENGKKAEKELLVVFKKPVRAISKGQSFVMYTDSGKMVLGGVIKE
jgi:tRNA-uridine 2-sulfurtransferase